jgi:hypothetical protein
MLCKSVHRWLISGDVRKLHVSRVISTDNKGGENTVRQCENTVNESLSIEELALFATCEAWDGDRDPVDRAAPTILAFPFTA